MSDATKHLANSILYKLKAKQDAAVSPQSAHMEAAPKFHAPHQSRIPHHVLNHAIDYIDKIKVAKSKL